jgi:hypothetical protein
MNKRSPPHILVDEHFIRLRRTRWGFETTSSQNPVDALKGARFAASFFDYFRLVLNLAARSIGDLFGDPAPENPTVQTLTFPVVVE